MVIQSNKAYKSLRPINPPVELPELVVLSGLNGTGKTHLIEGISNNIIELHDNGKQLNPIKFVSHNTLAPNNTNQVSPESRNIQEIWGIIRKYKTAKYRDPNLAFSIYSHKMDYDGIINQIAKSELKEIEDLNEHDIILNYPLPNQTAEANIFSQNFSILFKRYENKKYENKLNKFLNQEGDNVKFLSDEAFLETYGEPPWHLVNEIFREAHIDYEVTSPEGQRPEISFTPQLINIHTSVKINFSDLSSGEKVITSLALSLYNSKFDMAFPKVLLMDEPDAHLHPALTNQFFDVIKNVFIAEKGVKIIMTTHSPSTVALAPEESLFIMNKTDPRIVKASKDAALHVLTSGVPTLSINYENRRQVFVESKYDVLMYEKLYEKLSNQLIPEISLNFISSGVGGRGNCDQVKEVVNSLAGYGNKSIYGIIDWDGKNVGNEFVKVLGPGNRYSIENYILDPILVAAFLIRDKIVDKTSIALEAKDKYTDFANFNEAKLQAIADCIVKKVQSETKIPMNTDLKESEYICGLKIKLPAWLLLIQGHELESIFKKLFPELNRFKNEGDLKMEIINKVIDDMPEFIPKDLLNVLESIQNYL